MDIYATHLPMLMTVVSHTKGPILEMGCGDYSSFILHEICRVDRRRLVSTEEKLDWFKKFEHLRTDWHEFYLIKDWASFALLDEAAWDVVFVDHAPGERRKFDIDRLRKNAQYLVVHDTEEAGYQYEPVLQSFKYRFDYTAIRPWTSVVSEFNSLDFLRM